MKTFLLLLLLVLPAVAGRPNIVVLLVDDWGWSDLKANNAASIIETPNLDAFAASGTRFSRAYAPSSICSPTREAMLYGMFVNRGSFPLVDNVGGGGGVVREYESCLTHPERTPLPLALKNAGYQTIFSGKWHLGITYQPLAGHSGHVGQASGTIIDEADVDFSAPAIAGPKTYGFDNILTPDIPNGAPYGWFDGDTWSTMAGTGFPAMSTTDTDTYGWYASGPKDVGPQPAGAIDATYTYQNIDPVCANYTATQIAAASAPYFVWHAFHARHLPQVPRAAFDGSTTNLYTDWVADLDDTFQTILDAIEARGDADDTLIIVTGDNGSDAATGVHTGSQQFSTTLVTPGDGHYPNAPHRGAKATNLLSGQHVPMIVRWVGRTVPGSVQESPISIVDVYATACEAARAQIGPADAPDSESFLEALDGRPWVRKGAILTSGSGTFPYAAISRGFVGLDSTNEAGGSAPTRGTVQRLYRQDDPAQSTDVKSTYTAAKTQIESFLLNLSETSRTAPRVK